MAAKPRVTGDVAFFSGPQAFWHQGLVLWKTVFSEDGEGDGLG